MALTPFMNLLLPTPTVTLGPEYAVENNYAFEAIDAHNHTSGKGVQIPVAGLNIDTDLSFNSFRASFLYSTKYITQPGSLSGAANASSVYSVGGNLYFTNGSGVPIQITSGGSVVSVPADVESFTFNSFNTDLSIAPSDNFVFISMDTSAPRAITLPLSAAVTPGRFYIIKDATNSSETNNITVNPSGADLVEFASSYVIASDGSATVVTADGLSNWFIS